MYKQVIARFAAIGAAALAVVGAAPAASADPVDGVPLDGLDSLVAGYVTDALAANDVPGAAVSVVAGGETVYSGGFGLADIASQTPVDPERTGFLIGSQTKLFTAQAALRLVAEGALDLDADVNGYLPGFQIADAYPGRPVTLRHLLTHTAGFDDDNLIGSGGTDAAAIPDFAERMAAVQPERVRPPGETVTYSNYGYSLAGYLVQAVSGMPYERYVAENVLAPLGMTATTVAVPYPAAVTATLATGYTSDIGRNNPSELAYADTPAAGAGPVSTSADMARYMIAALTADPRMGPGASEMLKPQYTEDAALPGMGFGWEQTLIGGHPAWFKGGDFPGHHATMFLLPEYGIGLHLVSNGDGYGGNGVDGFALARQIAARHLPAPTAPEATAMPGAESAAYEGWYHSSRTSHNSFYKVKALFEKPIRVRATDGGGIITDGIWDDGITWVQTAPGRFQRPGTWDRLVFQPDGTIAVSGATEVLERTGPLEHPYVHLALLASALLTALAALIWLPAAALSRRRKGLASPSRTALAARVAAWTAAALIVGTTALLITLAAVPSHFQTALVTASVPLLTMLIMATLTVPAAVALAALTAAAWSRGWWSRRGRLGHTAVTMATMAFVAVALIYNMTGPSFT